VWGGIFSLGLSFCARFSFVMQVNLHYLLCDILQFLCVRRKFLFSHKLRVFYNMLILSRFLFAEKIRLSIRIFL